MKVAIIGGSGKMGRWFAGVLHKDGTDVVITGRNMDKLQQAGEELGVRAASISEAVKSSDVILLSVSIDSFEEVVARISPLIRSSQTVIDITSTKVFPVEIMHMVSASRAYQANAAILKRYEDSMDVALELLR